MNDRESDREHAGKDALSNRETYNLVTDTVGGPNLRLRDNLYQGLAILICAILGAGIGWLVAKDAFTGIAAGLGGGLIVGLLASGFFLMIYRAVQHARGKHD
jgi:hypothetical protein